MIFFLQVTASNDFNLKVWDLRTANTLHDLVGHTAPINSVSYRVSDICYSLSFDLSGTEALNSLWCLLLLNGCPSKYWTGSLGGHYLSDVVEIIAFCVTLEVNMYLYTHPLLHWLDVTQGQFLLNVYAIPHIYCMRPIHLAHCYSNFLNPLKKKNSK